MPSVTLRWIEENAEALKFELENLHKEVAGKEPADGSVSGDQYKEAHAILNNIEQAAESFFQAYVHIVDEDDPHMDDPKPRVHYEEGYNALETAATNEVPPLPFKWRKEFRAAQETLQEKLREIPHP